MNTLNHDTVRSQRTDINRIFHALGDLTRRSIIEKLGEGPSSASQLATPLNMSVAAVMQHLQVLEQCGLVSTEKVGRTRVCRINLTGLSVVEQWINDRRASWVRRLDRLGELLAEPDSE